MSDPRPGEPGPADEPGTPPTHHEYGQPYDPPSYGQQPYGGGAPGYGYGYATPAANHPSATLSLVLGLVGLVGLVLCGGLTLVLSPFAWRLGARAVREIDAEPGRYAGRDQANAGRIMGIIGTVLLVIGVLLILGLVVLAVGLAGSGGVATNSHA